MTMVIEVRNPYALMTPSVQGVLRRGIEKDVLLAPGGWDELAPDILRFVQEPKSFLLLGAEDGDFKSFVMGYMPGSRLFPYPTVVLFYNEGSKALLEATKAKLLEIILQNGHTKMLSMNHTGKSDRAWKKVLTPKGVKATTLGSMVMFEVE